VLMGILKRFPYLRQDGNGLGDMKPLSHMAQPGYQIDNTTLQKRISSGLTSGS
jgi:hypothetical protein